MGTLWLPACLLPPSALRATRLLYPLFPSMPTGLSLVPLFYLLKEVLSPQQYHGAEDKCPRVTLSYTMYPV